MVFSIDFVVDSHVELRGEAVKKKIFDQAIVSRDFGCADLPSVNKNATESHFIGNFDPNC